MKVLILTTIRAPYRVRLFDLLGEKCELTVCFEKEKEKGREEQWYEKRVVNFKDIQLVKQAFGFKYSVESVIKDIKPDIALVYEYSTKTSMLFIFLCLKHKIPYFINCDGGFVSNHLFKSFIKKLYIKNAMGFFAGGEWAKLYLEYYGATSEKIGIHYFSSLNKNNINEKPFTNLEKKDIRQKLGINESKVIIGVGQFIYRKGFDVLLKACKDFDDNIGIYLIGGNSNNIYEEICKKYSLHNVHFIEFQSEKILSMYYDAADIMVLPTREDIWGLVINEAMAHALPVITTKRCIAGLELIENGKNGFIINEEDPVELGEKIIFLLERDELRKTMETNNLKKISNYTLENMAKCQIDHINRLYREKK